MLTTTPRETLLTAIARTLGIVDRRSSNPALSQALIEATTAGLRITADDSMYRLTGVYPATITEPGATCVDAALLHSALRAASGPTVTLTTVGNRLCVSCGSAVYNLPTTEPADFPPAPHIKAPVDLTIPGANLARLITETAHAVAANENRYGLNGVHAEEVIGSDGTPRLRLVATDGSRLNYSDAPFTGRLACPPKTLIPPKALGEVRKLIEADPDAAWTVGFESRSLRFTAGHLTLTCRTIDGEFPEYRQVLPKSHKRTATLSAPDLAAALRGVRVMANDQNYLVRFSFEPDRLVLSAQNPEAGDVRGEVPIDLSGGPLLTGFNLTFFTDIIAATKASRLTLQLGEALDPCIVTIPGRDDCLFVVMPMRLE